MSACADHDQVGELDVGGGDHRVRDGKRLNPARADMSKDQIRP